jgi:hypothetical protein
LFECEQMPEAGPRKVTVMVCGEPEHPGSDLYLKQKGDLSRKVRLSAVLHPRQPVCPVIVDYLSDLLLAWSDSRAAISAASPAPFNRSPNLTVKLANHRERGDHFLIYSAEHMLITVYKQLVLAR